MTWSKIASSIEILDGTIEKFAAELAKRNAIRNPDDLKNALRPLAKSGDDAGKRELETAHDAFAELRSSADGDAYVAKLTGRLTSAHHLLKAGVHWFKASRPGNRASGCRHPRRGG